MELISRKEAAARGLSRYFTGKPCLHGHVVDRTVVGYHCVECVHGYHARNGEERRDQQRIYREKIGVDNWRARAKKWAEENRERTRKNAARWQAENPDRYRENKRVRTATRKRTDIQFRLAMALRQRICKAIRKNWKCGSAVADLGCSIDDLKAYLERLFHSGMDWENLGKGHGKWNIDHRRPLASFDLADREQFLAACHFSNLQPLWALENILKGARRG